MVLLAATVYGELAPANAQRSSRLDLIRARGTLGCGVPANMPGFSVVVDETDATGMDADLCRAAAATIFGVDGRARFIAVDTIDQFLADERIDMVFHALTWKPARERRWGIAFVARTFADGQALAVRSTDGITRASQLGGRTVCVEAGTIFAAAVMRMRPRVRVLALPDGSAAKGAFLAGRCEAWSWDASGLFAALSGLDGKDFRILSERLSAEPLSPIVRAADQDLADLFRQTLRKLVANGEYDQIISRNFTGPGHPRMDLAGFQER